MAFHAEPFVNHKSVQRGRTAPGTRHGLYTVLHMGGMHSRHEAHVGYGPVDVDGNMAFMLASTVSL